MLLTLSETWKNLIFSPSSNWWWCLMIDFDVSAVMIIVIPINLRRCGGGGAVASRHLPAWPIQTQKCGQRRKWPIWNIKMVGADLGVWACLRFTRQENEAPIQRSRLETSAKRPSLWRANMALEDKESSNADWHFIWQMISVHSAMKQDWRREVQQRYRGRRRGGFPRHLGDLAEETVKQHNLNHTARYHQDSLFMCECVGVCVKIKIGSWCVCVWTPLPIFCVDVHILAMCKRLYMWRSICICVCVCVIP